MPQNDLYQKFINFDLSTKELLKHFPNGTAKPYGELKKFFLARDFEHRQYSGYLSKNFLDKFDISFIAKELGVSGTEYQMGKKYIQKIVLTVRILLLK